MKEYNPRIECADGFSISVQANSGVYCRPQLDNVPHTHMEGGFPSSKPLSQDLLMYADDSDDWDDCEDEFDYTETVYPFVPREVFEREFELHGGIVNGRLPD